MDKNKGKKIGIAGNHSTTIDLARSILQKGYKIDCIINMESDLKGEIAGYIDLKEFADKNNIVIIRPKTYSLKHEEDIDTISKRKLDILLVFGWQRLIPEWLLMSLPIGAFGTHGSWKRLPYGRGRSLHNWGLFLGKDKMIENLFKYDVAADSGDIIDSIKFSITPFDDISTLHHKDQIVHQTLIIKYLPKLLSGNRIKYKPQSKNVKEVFFPKRSPEDGVIDWTWKAKDIYNLVRAVSRPYPGAFTYYKKNKIYIFRAIPFEPFDIFSRSKPGEIVASFSDNTFVVKTGDSTLLVQDYEAKKWHPVLCIKFRSEKNKSFEKLKISKIKW